MDRVKSDIEDQSYYLSTADGTVLQRQVNFHVWYDLYLFPELW